MIALTRLERFRRVLRGAIPAHESIQRLASEIATKLGVRQIPRVCYLDGVFSPFVWCIGFRPTIYLPMRQRGDPDDQDVALILAHELAHLRRCDHWVRLVELFVSIVHWWNPLAWLVRRQIHQAEDVCCDAWVRWAFPTCARRYAEVLLETAESLCALPDRGSLPLTSPFLRPLSLKGRIEMVLEGRFAPQLSRTSRLVVLTLAIVVLPLFVRTTVMKAAALPDDDAPKRRGQIQKPRRNPFLPTRSLSNKARRASRMATASPSSMFAARPTKPRRNPIFPTRFLSNKARHASRMATASPSSMFAARPTNLRSATFI